MWSGPSVQTLASSTVSRRHSPSSAKMTGPHSKPKVGSSGSGQAVLAVHFSRWERPQSRSLAMAKPPTTLIWLLPQGELDRYIQSHPFTGRERNPGRPYGSGLAHSRLQRLRNERSASSVRSFARRRRAERAASPEPSRATSLTSLEKRDADFDDVDGGTHKSLVAIVRSRSRY